VYFANTENDQIPFGAIAFAKISPLLQMLNVTEKVVNAVFPSLQ